MSLVNTKGFDTFTKSSYEKFYSDYSLVEPMFCGIDYKPIRQNSKVKYYTESYKVSSTKNCVQNITLSGPPGLAWIMFSLPILEI